MDKLLDKIRKPYANKCRLAELVYPQISRDLSQINDGLSINQVNINQVDAQLDQIEAVLFELEAKLYGIDPSTYREFATEIGILIINYHQCLETLKSFNLINQTKTAYYGTEDFRNQRFNVPTLPSILSLLTPKHLALYREMEESGLKPKLQLTPIATHIRRLAVSLSANHSHEIEITMDEYKLLYDYQSCKVSADGKKLELEGGMPDFDLIRKKNGWSIDIVSTVPELEVEPGDYKDPQFTNAVKTAEYIHKYQALGYSGLTPEIYLCAQMQAVLDGQPLDTQRYTLLTGALPPNSIPIGVWVKNHVALRKLDSYQTSFQPTFRRCIKLNG